jgi:hypothetical protein
MHAFGRRFYLRLLDKDPLLDGLESLVLGPPGRLAKDQLGLELPGLGELPGGKDLGDDTRVKVKVLKIGAQALGLKSGPD